MLSDRFLPTDFDAFARRGVRGVHPGTQRINTQRSRGVEMQGAPCVGELAIDDVALGFRARSKPREHAAADRTQHFAPAVESIGTRGFPARDARNDGVREDMVDLVSQYVDFCVARGVHRTAPCHVATDGAYGVTVLARLMWCCS